MKTDVIVISNHLLTLENRENELRKQNEIFCKGCKLFDRYNSLPCVGLLDKRNKCPKQNKDKGY